MTLLPLPIIYLDTNVCRDCIKNRSKKTKDSVHLMGIIKDQRWECITSTFTFMELYDIEKDDYFFYKKQRLGWDINAILRERRYKDLSDSDLNEVHERISGFFDEYDFIKFHQLDGEEGWEIAEMMNSTTNLSAADSIHLAVAWGTACDLLITSDQGLIDEATKFLKENDLWNDMRICKPYEAVKVVEKLMKLKLREKILKREPVESIPSDEQLYDLEGIGPVTLSKLVNADIFTISDLILEDPSKLMKKLGFGDPEIAKKIINSAKKAQKKIS